MSERVESADIPVIDRDILLEAAIVDIGLGDGYLVNQRVQQPRRQLVEFTVLDKQIRDLFSQGPPVFFLSPDLLVGGNLSLDNFLLILILLHHTIEVACVDLPEQMILIELVQQLVQIGEPLRQCSVDLRGIALLRLLGCGSYDPVNQCLPVQLRLPTKRTDILQHNSRDIVLENLVLGATMDAVGGVGGANEDHPVAVASILPTSQRLAAVGTFENAGERVRRVFHGVLVILPLDCYKLIGSFPNLPRNKPFMGVPHNDPFALIRFWVLLRLEDGFGTPIGEIAAVNRVSDQVPNGFRPPDIPGILCREHLSLVQPASVAQGDGPFVLTICVRSRRGFLSSGRFNGLTGPHSSTPGVFPGGR